MKVHSFYVEDAEKHGVEKAVILYNMRFWLEKNKANKKHDYDGYYWMYNSAKAFAVLFPYYKASKIERLLRQMEKDELILSGNYNKAGYDRTKWYSMPDFRSESLDTPQSSNMKNGIFKNEECNLQKCSMESSNMKNGIFKNEAPIPDINTDTNTDINTDINTDNRSDELSNDEFELSGEQSKTEREILVDSLFDKWKELSGQNIKPSDKRLGHINARLNDGFTPDQIITAMTFVATDKWHIENAQNKIEIAIRSVEQIEKKLIAAAKPVKKDPLAVNQNWSNASKRKPLVSTVTYEEMMGGVQ